ncbi:MAG: S8 family peptidase [Myxococcota bacterium]
MRNSWKLGALVVGLAAGVWMSIDVRSVEDAAPDVASEAADRPTGRVLIDLDDDTSASERDAIEGLIHDAIAPFDWPEGDEAMGELLSDPAELYAVEAPASEIRDVLVALRGAEDVEAVEVEREWSIPSGSFASVENAADGETARGPFRPNDPYYKHQWHLDQIQMPQAWLRNRGEGVVVAVIDTGVSYRNGGRFKQAPDLAATRFVPGYDFVENDNTPDDEHGHGTHVAGTVAQSTNNNLGVAGVAPEAAIMPIRVLDRRGAGAWGGVAAGIRWAADNGADVINLSLGGSTRSSAISNAIAHAHRKGVVVVAAAGNTGRGRVQYPGADRFAIGVGAVRFDESLSFYSSYGRNLDVVAPGGDLRVDQNADGLPDGVLQNTILRGNPARHDYLAFQGTSMAAPHVAGVAALIRASGVQDPAAVERILQETAKDKRDRHRYGAGLIQADAALRAATRDLGATRGAAGFAFAALILIGLRRRENLVPTLAATGVVSGAATALPWSWIGLAAPVAPLAWLGSLGGFGLLALFVLPVGLVGLFYGKRSLRPWIAGACFGVAGFAAVEALVPTLALGGAFVGPVLVGAAVLAAVLGRQVLSR